MWDPAKSRVMPIVLEAEPHGKRVVHTENTILIKDTESSSKYSVLLKLYTDKILAHGSACAK